MSSGELTIRSFSDLMRIAERFGPIRVAIASAHDPEVLVAAEESQKRGIAKCALIGDLGRIRGMASDEGLSLQGMTLEEQADDHLAARRAVELARTGQADAVAKGQLKTDQLLAAALDRDSGIRHRRLMTHVGIFEVPGVDRLLYVSDSGVVLYPTVYQKLEIILNVVDVAHLFGVEEPRVAILAASEFVHPKVPASVDAIALSRMAGQGWVEGALVDGPMSLDVAISPEAAAAKGLGGPVAGRADVLIVPSVEAGNTMAKGILYFAHGLMAGLVVGARVPIIINSRADSHEIRVRSIAMAVALSAAFGSARGRLGLRYEDSVRPGAEDSLYR